MKTYDECLENENWEYEYFIDDRASRERFVDKKDAISVDISDNDDLH